MSRLIEALAGLGKLWLERSIAKIIRTSALIIIVQTGIIIFFFSQLPPQVPLYYSRPWGESQLAPTHHLFLLPGFSLLFLLVNSTLAVPFIEKKKFLSVCLAWTSLIVSGLALITLIEIISVTL